jgi:beta-glucosidase/6-phospho-beta-glucosidase/beta-galactosidase
MPIGWLRRRHNLEPVVTLQHFTHPAWLSGRGWMTARRPEQLVSTAVAHVNRRLVEVHGERPLRWFVTINEPNMLVINTYLNRHAGGAIAA